jgi:hypothetical protein
MALRSPSETVEFREPDVMRFYEMGMLSADVHPSRDGLTMSFLSRPSNSTRFLESCSVLGCNRPLRMNNSSHNEHLSWLELERGNARHTVDVFLVPRSLPRCQGLANLSSGQKRRTEDPLNPCFRFKNNSLAF